MTNWPPEMVEGDGTDAAPNDRAYLVAEVEARALHRTKEEVRTTCSFARAERLFGREYHGRFLIEMLQNAADAWDADPRSAEGGSKVSVVISPQGPALLVANQGAPMLASTVIESLGHIGASTKSEGESIGHKGIGFKSVLEMTSTPEIYSDFTEGSPRLAVRFDPIQALRTIRDRSPDWDTLLDEVGAPQPDYEISAIPVLRYPHWVNDVPPAVMELGEDGFDTVVRLPYEGAPEGLSEWLAAVRNGLSDITDQILVLLGCFSEVRVTDQISGESTLIAPMWQPRAPGSSHEAVTVVRNDVPSSRWILYRRTLTDETGMGAELAAGLRLSGSSNAVASASDHGPSAPFHLFFPTRISSGLPLLLHGYFSVDASRTGFYQGARDQNEEILAALAGLVADAIVDAGQSGLVDPVSLINLIADCPTPEDPQALGFHGGVLRLLDDRAWIPVSEVANQDSLARPRDVFVAPSDLSAKVARCFTPKYVSDRLGTRLPSPDLSGKALSIIASRQPVDHPTVWSAMEQLLRPGTTNLWDAHQADAGFLALLDLLDVLRAVDVHRTETLVTALPGDPDTRLLPVAVGSSDRELSAVPDPSSGVVGRRSQLVMARVRLSDSELPAPPPELGVSFLADGLLDSETQIDRAKRLGVRPFTVDNVLDRLNGLAWTAVDPATVVNFLWTLLSRERVSSFSTQRCAERASALDPDAWFWCTPGRPVDEASRERRQRERFLAGVRLPARDGSWRPAGELAFGSDWAAWLADAVGGSKVRVDAYSALEELNPGPEAMLASPELLVPLLSRPVIESESSEGPSIDAERHAFLLRLGVWEVLPLEAFENRQRADRDPFPWPGDIEDARQEEIRGSGGWTFGLDGWAGKRHTSVHVAEDYRFAWDIEKAAERSTSALARSLEYGLQLYAKRLTAQFFCASCRDSGSGHTVMRTSRAEDRYPSWMALQLRNSRWVSAMVDGKPLAKHMTPQVIWWRAKLPTGAALRQSPWRLVPTCGPETGISQDLKRLAGMSSIDDASPEDALRLLGWLHKRFDADALPADPRLSGSARQAFIGLHRQAYERLADLASDRQDDAPFETLLSEVLCERGNELVYVSVADALHDDGRYSSYVRHFVGKIPFVVLPRDQAPRAARLGVAPLIVDLTRRGTDEGLDVTQDLHALLSDRFAELLAIVVHHSLGTQTLDINSSQFEARATRLKALSVRQVPDLVIDARVRDKDIETTIGEGSDQDLFLEAANPAAPILYCDLSGLDWQERLRRKIGPYLAAVLENSAYAHTFSLFLQQESDAEREEFLLELGISAADVEEIATRIGTVGHEQRVARKRWLAALGRILGWETAGDEEQQEQVTAWLRSAGLSAESAALFERSLGTESARSDPSDGGPLRVLEAAGVDLSELDGQLRLLGDQGLRVNVAQQRFAKWMDANGRRVVAVLTTDDPAVAKKSVRQLSFPYELAFSLDPAMSALLEPVAALLAAHGLHASGADLADSPSATLAAAAGYPSPAELDARAELLYDDEERARVLRERAAQWKRELRLLAVLSRMGASETRSTVRLLDSEVGDRLPSVPSRPSQLTDAVQDLFSAHPQLSAELASMLDDSVLSAPPDRQRLLEQAAADGIAVERLPVLHRALDAPRRDQARAIQARSEQLRIRGVAPAIPAGMVAANSAPREPGRPPAPGPKQVAAVKVGEGHDRRKRELGDEGEQWALAAVVGNVVELESEQRNLALGAFEEMLAHFQGAPVDAALSHLDAARSESADEEDLIDDLRGLMHVSRHSDGFGFDLLGWLSVSEGSEPIAVCIEVKSAGGHEFHFTASEWALAERFHEEARGERYAVLVVHRGKRGGPPTSMDLLIDPVRLVREGKLVRAADGYVVRYEVAVGQPN